MNCEVFEVARGRLRHRRTHRPDNMPPTLVERRRPTPYDRPNPRPRHHRRNNSQSKTHRRTSSGLTWPLGPARRYEVQATGPKQQLDHCHWEPLPELEFRTFYATQPWKKSPEAPSVYVTNLQERDRLYEASKWGVKRRLSVITVTEDGDRSVRDVPLVTSPIEIGSEETDGPDPVWRIILLQLEAETAVQVPAWFQPPSPYPPQSSRGPPTPPPLLIHSLAASPESIYQPEEFEGHETENVEEDAAGESYEQQDHGDEDAEGETDDEAEGESDNGAVADQSWGYHLGCSHESAAAHLRQLLSNRQDIMIVYGPSSAFAQLDVPSLTPVDPHRDYRQIPELPPTLAETYNQLRRMLQRPFPSKTDYSARIEHALDLTTSLPTSQPVCRNCAENEPELALTLMLLDVRTRDQSQRLKIADAQIVSAAGREGIVWAEEQGTIPKTPPLVPQAAKGKVKSKRRKTTKKMKKEEPEAKVQTKNVGGHKGKWRLEEFKPQDPRVPQEDVRTVNTQRLIPGKEGASISLAPSVTSAPQASTSASVTQQPAQRAQAQSKAQPPIPAPSSSIVAPTSIVTANNNNNFISNQNVRKHENVRREEEEEPPLERTQPDAEYGMPTPPAPSPPGRPPQPSPASYPFVATGITLPMTMQQPQLPAENQARLAAFQQGVLAPGPRRNPDADRLIRAHMAYNRPEPEGSPIAPPVVMTGGGWSPSKANKPQQAQQVQNQRATSQPHAPQTAVTTAMIHHALQQIRQPHGQQQQVRQQAQRDLGLGRPVKRRRFETTDSTREVAQALAPNSMGSVNAVDAQLQPSFTTQPSFATEPSSPSWPSQDFNVQQTPHVQQQYQRALQQATPSGVHGGSGWGGSVRRSQQSSQHQSFASHNNQHLQSQSQLNPTELSPGQRKNLIRNRILYGEPYAETNLPLFGSEQAPTPPLHHPTPANPISTPGSSTPVIPTPLPSRRLTPTSLGTPVMNLTPQAGLASLPASRSMMPGVQPRAQQPQPNLQQTGHPFLQYANGLEYTEERVEFLGHWNETWNRQYDEEQRVRSSLAQPQQVQVQQFQQASFPSFLQQTAQTAQPVQQAQQAQQTRSQPAQVPQQIDPQLLQSQMQQQGQETSERTPTLEELEQCVAVLDSMENALPFDFSAYSDVGQLAVGRAQPQPQYPQQEVHYQQQAQYPQQEVQHLQQSQQYQYPQQSPAQHQQDQFQQQPQQSYQPDQYQQAQYAESQCRQSQQQQPYFDFSSLRTEYQSIHTGPLGLTLDPTASPLAGPSSLPALAQPAQPLQPAQPASQAATADKAGNENGGTESPRIVHHPNGTRTLMAYIAYLSTGTTRKTSTPVPPGVSDAEALARARGVVAMGNEMEIERYLPRLRGAASSGQGTAAGANKRKRDDEDDEDDDEDHEDEDEDEDEDAEGESDDAEGSDDTSD